MTSSETGLCSVEFKPYILAMAAAFAVTIVLTLAAPLPAPYLPGPVAAYAAEDWEKDFEEVSSKTDSAMALSVDELKALIKKCDDMKAKIEATDDSKGKVYLRRLQRTRDFYAFVLESKEKK